MGVLGGLRSALSFLTILPVGQGTLEEMARYAFFFPAVGAVLGALSGGAGLVLFSFLDQSLAGWSVLFLLLFLTGLNHLDGVLDLGDALMVRGTRERRLEVLHDKHHGIGGHFALFFVLVLTGTLISLLGHSVFSILLAAETCAKLSMVIAAAVGKPYEKGIGGLFVSKVKERLLSNVVLGIFIASTITILVTGQLQSAIAALAVALAFPAIWTKYLEKVFGCLTGDMLGSTSELTRLLVLLAFYLLWGVLH
ncbi:MAG: adenosylcobinamide-GDP ribazoletransferase [Candidatus Verstraetearchaeota archaeon]|nr:adenosylcobinamide-GDP ribazoletransferase [Candidatus Verstraetearchaeota archaeon]